MDQLSSILSEAQARFVREPSGETVDWLAQQLAVSFDDAASAGYLPAFQAFCREHPLSELLLKDPYSKRALEKPRGYAGDAVMLDYIYRPDATDLDEVASVVHRATTTLPNAKSILWRRDYLAGLIHDHMRTRERAQVMSVASGHMRELDTLRTITSDTNVAFTALDQDAESIAEAKNTYDEYTIQGINASFMHLIKKKSTARFDLIYSAGLFDYLSEAMAIALLKAMFARLRPGGMLSIGNFTRDSHGRGFMAGFMHWCLVYRNEADMRAIAEAACPGASYRLFRDVPRNVVYLEVYAE